MRTLAIIACLIVVVICAAWLITKPAFDSAAATGAAFAALVGSYFFRKHGADGGGQNQHVSGSSVGIQAGRDANVDSAKRK